MEEGRRVWAVGGGVAHGLSPQPSVQRTEKGEEGLRVGQSFLAGSSSSASFS